MVSYGKTFIPHSGDDGPASEGQTGPYMESYTDISIYGRHIRSYESYTVCEKWTIYGPKTTIYGSHRTKTYMVVIYGRDHIWSGPVYDSNPRPYMGNHIWSGPYMVLLTIYGRTNF